MPRLRQGFVGQASIGVCLLFERWIEPRLARRSNALIILMFVLNSAILLQYQALGLDAEACQIHCQSYNNQLHY